MKLLKILLLAGLLLVSVKPVFAETTDYTLCSQVPTAEAKQSCEKCEAKEAGQVKGVWTAVGCIKTDSQEIVKTVMNIGLGVAGGIALVLILSSSVLFSISRGEPKRTSDAKEMLTNTIIGLLFIIFSVTILQFIGQSIFKIPGL